MSQLLRHGLDQLLIGVNTKDFVTVFHQLTSEGGSEATHTDDDNTLVEVPLLCLVSQVTAFPLVTHSGAL